MRQSKDLVTALLDFYTKFPEFLPNELYVSGESYGGIYVPYLSW
jgi:carboxypeptidase C (cathepsin A)